MNHETIFYLNSGNIGSIKIKYKILYNLQRRRTLFIFDKFNRNFKTEKFIFDDYYVENIKKDDYNFDLKKRKIIRHG